MELNLIFQSLVLEQHIAFLFSGVCLVVFMLVLLLEFSFEQPEITFIINLFIWRILGSKCLRPQKSLHIQFHEFAFE